MVSYTPTSRHQSEGGDQCGVDGTQQVPQVSLAKGSAVTSPAVCGSTVPSCQREGIYVPLEMHGGKRTDSRLCVDLTALS